MLCMQQPDIQLETLEATLSGSDIISQSLPSGRSALDQDSDSELPLTLLLLAVNRGRWVHDNRLLDAILAFDVGTPCSPRQEGDTSPSSSDSNAKETLEVTEGERGGTGIVVDKEKL